MLGSVQQISLANIRNNEVNPIVKMRIQCESQELELSVKYRSTLRELKPELAKLCQIPDNELVVLYGDEELPDEMQIICNREEPQ